MGQRGPTPAPDNVRLIRGMKPLRNKEGHRVRRLVLAPKAPAPPGGLSRAAGAEWRRVTKELARAGVLAEVDRGILTAYVTSWSHMMEAEALLKSEGVTRPGREGTVVKNPAWQIYREALRTMQMAASQLYLTPVSRLRIPIAPGLPDDDDSDDTFD